MRIFEKIILCKHLFTYNCGTYMGQDLCNTNTDTDKSWIQQSFVEYPARFIASSCFTAMTKQVKTNLLILQTDFESRRGEE